MEDVQVKEEEGLSPASRSRSRSRSRSPQVKP